MGIVFQEEGLQLPASSKCWVSEYVCEILENKSQVRISNFQVLYSSTKA